MNDLREIIDELVGMFEGQQAEINALRHRLHEVEALLLSVKDRQDHPLKKRADGTA